MNLQNLFRVSRHLSNDKRDALLQFLEGAMAVAKAPSSAAQEIIGMMKAMRDEMQKDLDESRKVEAEDAQSFGEMKESKEEHLGILMKTLSDKQKRSGELA